MNQPTETIEHSQPFPRSVRIVRAVSWLVVVIAALNTLYFVLRSACTVIRSDEWYFLDVFLRKAIAGDLAVADFFVKRAYADHAQPLLKLVLFAEWKYFDLDILLGGILGVAATALCAWLYHRILIANRPRKELGVNSYLAWAGICALLFSLNGGPSNQWAWQLMSLANITNLLVLLFTMSVWRAHRTQRYHLLMFMVLFVGITTDDSALVASIALILSLLIAQIGDPRQRSHSAWKVIAILVAGMIVVRLGYSYAPVSGGTVPPLTHNLNAMLDGFVDYGWWKWIVVFLSLPVAYKQQLHTLAPEMWFELQICIASVLVVAHLWFWWKALSSKYDARVYVAVSTMFVAYAMLAGVIFYRTPGFGADAVEQPRYAMLYAGQLFALLLMWAGTSKLESSPRGERFKLISSMPTLGCFLLIAVQIPLARIAWQNYPYLLIYYANMAKEIDQVARNPTLSVTCLPEVTLCEAGSEKRAELTQMLARNQLNLFSPTLQQRYSYLPRLLPPAGDASPKINGAKSD